MGNLVFQAALGGQVAVSGPNTASSYTINVPTVNGTFVTTGDTGTVTTTMLASTTGSGAVVLATSPTLETPALGTPSSITLTNATGLPISTGLSGLTTNGVAYATSTTALATGSNLTFNGTQLGIGTNSPTSGYSLDVRNRSRIVSTTNYVLDLIGSGTNTSTIQFYADNSVGAIITTGTSAIPLAFYTNGSEQMRLTSAGYLGIGTSSPSYRLQVNGSGTGDQVQFTDGTYQSIRFGTSTTGVYYNNPNGGYQAWQISGTEQMRLDSSGNLGLGVTPSAWASGFKVIQLSGNSSFFNNGQGCYYGLGANVYYDGSNYKYIGSTYAGFHRFNALGQYEWNVAGSGTGGNNISFTTAMTLDNSGRLLVGTTTSSGNIATFKGSQQSFIIRNGVDSDYNELGVWDGSTDQCKAVIKNEGGLGKFGTRTNSPMVFQTNDTERARIDTSGNLLVRNTNRGGQATICPDGIVSTQPAISCYQNATSSQEQITFRTPNGVVGSITTSGTTTLYNVTSDQRLKTNIVDAPNGNIDEIKIRSFDWKADNSHNTYGVIAQELFEVAPYAVYKPNDENQMMAVDYSKLVPMMIKEIQSLKAEVAKLKGA